MKLVFLIFFFGWEASVSALTFSWKERNILLSTDDVKNGTNLVESNQATHAEENDLVQINLLQPGNAADFIKNISINRNTSFFAIIGIFLGQNSTAGDISAISSNPGSENISSRNQKEDTRAETTVVAQINKTFNEGVIDTPPVRGREYFFLSDSEGFVLIIDAITYERNTSYTRMELAESSVAVVDNTFYNVRFRLGRIESIPVENLITQNFNWTEAGFFPSENYGFITNSAVADGKLIYFVTNAGNFYRYDTLTTTLIRLRNFRDDNFYVSLVAVKNSIYIFEHQYLHSFNGGSVEKIQSPPSPRRYSALFELEGSVCVVGGNDTDISPDPVQCYDPVRKTWRVHSYINNARRSLGVAKGRSGVHIFGGICSWNGQACDSGERLNVDENKWNYIQISYLTQKYKKDGYPIEPRSQAVTFYV